MRVIRNLKEGLDYGLVDAAKIKYFLEIHFSETLKFTCFFLLINQIYTNK